MRRGASTEYCFSSAHHSWCTSYSLICACWFLSPSRTQLPFLRRRRDLLLRLRGRRKPSTRRWNRGTLTRSEENRRRIRWTEKIRRRTSTGQQGLLGSRKSPPRRSFWRVLSFFFAASLYSLALFPCKLSEHELWRKREKQKGIIKEKKHFEMPLKDMSNYE